MRKSVLHTVICILLLFLHGCGFRLEGQANIPHELKALHLHSDTPYSALMHQITSHLKDAGVSILDSQQAAPLTLVVGPEKITRHVTNVSSTAEVKQLTLTDTVAFRIINRKGRTVVSPSSVTASRSFTVNTNLITANSVYEQEMLEPMRSELIFKLFLSLESRHTRKQLARH